MLNLIDKLKPIQKVATDKSKWKEFKVTDSLSTRVQVFTGEKIKSDFYIGGFDYTQSQNNMNPYGQPQYSTRTYVRMKGKEDVYATDGQLTMAFNKNSNEFRDKTVLRLKKGDLTRLTYTYPADSSFTLYKEGGKWMINGLLADSTKVDKYLSSVSYLSSSNFVDNTTGIANNPYFLLKIEGNNFAQPIKISAFHADTANKYLVSSTLNKGVYFSGSKAGLANKLFVGKNKFQSQ